MKYLTDTQAGEIPALSGLDDEQRRQTLADADALYAVIGEEPWITDSDLRQWAESNGQDPDRTTRALALLTDTSRIVQIGESSTGPA